MLSKDALAVFQSATNAAASRAQSIASSLHVDMGGIGVKAEIIISVKNIEEKTQEAMTGPLHGCSLNSSRRKCPACSRS